MNGTTITQTTDLYQYRTYLETLLNYGIESTSHFTNGFWYPGNGDLLPCDPTKAKSRNTGFVAGWTFVKKRKEMQPLSRLQSGICNVIPCLLPRVKL
jgi:hypothetical protein